MSVELLRRLLRLRCCFSLFASVVAVTGLKNTLLKISLSPGTVNSCHSGHFSLSSAFVDSTAASYLDNIQKVSLKWTRLIYLAMTVVPGVSSGEVMNFVVRFVL